VVVRQGNGSRRLGGDAVQDPVRAYFGELKGSYNYAASGPDPYFHWREIDWFSGLIPRSVFPQDSLYSFGAFLTICKVQRNEAEARIQAMAARHWQPEGISAIGARQTAEPCAGVTVDEPEGNNVDLEELAADRIVRLIEARFKGHELASLVEAILQAEGYTTYRSPAGADGGADILAGGGELGFGKPQICVEVKSGSDPVDRPTVDKLIGAGQKFGAETCLFVSRGGFKPNVQKELARDFFRVRLWSRKELLETLFAHYAQLPEEIRLALPLKRVWMVASEEGT
jgi:restriction system protein